MALLCSDMIKEIRKVAELYSKQELERRQRAAESIRQQRVTENKKKPDTIWLYWE